MKYTPTLHAVERAHHRLGIEPAQAQRWFNETMRKAKYLLSKQVGKRTQAIYETDDVRFVVDTGNNTVVTIYPKLNAFEILKPVFEREERRIKREVTRNTRRYELAIAELTVKMGERMTAKAKAKNPKTRELIQADIDELKTKIGRYQASITREQDKLTNFEMATRVYV